MSAPELRKQINSGVEFWLAEDEAEISGVMGIQDVLDVTLIRHAYVRTSCQRRGIGARLLNELLDKSRRPFLIGTWSAATWAINFYQQHGFELVPDAVVPDLLNKYWSIPVRQVETSVVLADRNWFIGA